MIQVVKLKNLKYSQISSTKESKLISNIENKNKNVTIVRHLVKYERFPEICSRKKPREKNECSGSDIEVIPCTSPLILPHWRTEGFDFSDIRKSSRWRNSIILSRDSVGLTSKLTRKGRGESYNKLNNFRRIHFFFWKKFDLDHAVIMANAKEKKKKEKTTLICNSWEEATIFVVDETAIFAGYASRPSSRMAPRRLVPGTSRYFYFLSFPCD